MVVGEMSTLCRAVCSRSPLGYAFVVSSTLPQGMLLKRSLHSIRRTYLNRHLEERHVQWWFKRYASKGSKIPLNKRKHSELVLESQRVGGRRTVKYLLGVVILMGGLTYAMIPIYRKFCQAQGGGFAVSAKDKDKIETMGKVRQRLIKVNFTADVFSSLQWQFKPLQNEVYVHPGETALAFYTAKNPTNKPVVGISTYSVTPFESGAYFAKIQCFCFEEQLLNPGEEVDMPVFFYIDPDFADDPLLEDVDELHLSYTFFESKEGLSLSMPLTPADRKSSQSSIVK